MPGTPHQNLAQVLQLEVPLIVRLAQRPMRVSEVTALAPGAIIELPKFADEDLEVLVNNTLIGTGQAVKVAENFGVRFTYLGPPRDAPATPGTAAGDAA